MESHVRLTSFFQVIEWIDKVQDATFISSKAAWLQNWDQTRRAQSKDGKEDFKGQTEQWREHAVSRRPFWHHCDAWKSLGDSPYEGQGLTKLRR